MWSAVCGNVLSARCCVFAARAWQVRNREGWSVPSDVSEPLRLKPAAPLPAGAPCVVVASADTVICTWEQPHSSGAYVRSYAVEVAEVTASRDFVYKVHIVGGCLRVPLRLVSV